MKYAFIAEHAKRHGVARLCGLLGVTRSGFYASQCRDDRKRQDDLRLLADIRRVHDEHQENYGGLKTWVTLKARGIACGRDRVLRLRRAHGIEAKRRKRHRITAAHYKLAATAPDLVQRNFHAPQPNRIWAGDLTFIRTREGWLHLAVLVDLYSRKVVGWAMDARSGQEVHLGALQMALEQRRPPPGLIHHTDRGVQYRSSSYLGTLAACGLIASMNGRKVPQDNAVAESFFSNLKNELIHHREFWTRAEAQIAIFDYIELFYNRKRIHQTLGYRTPEQAERDWRNGA